MASHINMLKLSVGSESVEQLIDWQRHRSRQIADGAYYHITRMWPKRTDEILAGGSMYWVIGGLIQCRQKITGFREIMGEDGIRRCGIVLDAEVVRTDIAPKRPFQGWRYLNPEDAPGDLRPGRATEAALPPSLAAALAEIGVR
ncbi:DUF1489 family protein [Oceaniglobus roseus]|uniref:DUF1489 family protein n=1 Tax=Oceaniglobus roseus TaxID=1737570 RepID=UPI000C7EC51C|nr:DUF1489 domain-containing protein [Kandeliimicrobium roseum]